MTYCEPLSKQDFQKIVCENLTVRLIAVVAFTFVIVFARDVIAQERISPTQAATGNVDASKTDSLSISLNDGDYLAGSINQHGKLNLTILYPDGSLLRRITLPSGDAKSDFAFTAEGGGNIRSILRTPATNPPNTNFSWRRYWR